MSGAGGKWMASSVTEENITKLREAGYLAENIAHRLPTEGQITPTPNMMRSYGEGENLGA